MSMKNLSRNSFQDHPFHLVSPSHWPLDFYRWISILTLKYTYISTYNIPKPHSYISLPKQSSVLVDILFEIALILEESQGFNDYWNNATDLLPSIDLDLDYKEDLNLFEDSISSSEYNILDLDNSRFLSDPLQEQLDQLRGLWEDQGIYDPVADPELFDSWFDPDIINHTANSSSLLNDSKTLSDMSYSLFVEGIQMDNLQMVNKSLDASYSIFMQVPDHLRDITVDLAYIAYHCTGHEWKDIGSNQPALVFWRCSGCNSGPHIAILECVHCKIKRCRNCTLKR